MEDIFPKQKNFCAIKRPVNDEDRQWFSEQLGKVDRMKGFHWLLQPEPDVSSVQAIKTVEEVSHTGNFLKAADRVAHVCSELVVTAEQINAAEMATRGQHKNPVWSMLRKGRITASNFGPVLKVCSSRRTPSKSLLASLLGTYDLSGVHAVQWGLLHEATAIAEYTGSRGVAVHESGLWLSKSGLLGGSPDGIIDDNCIIEVKCPYSARSTALRDLCTGKSSFLTVNVDGIFSLNQKDETGKKYWHQVQGNMHFTGRTSCDFIVWTPQETAVFNVARDPKWCDNIPNLEKFYKEQFLPVFLDGGV